ncbi:DMT family transporter [Aquimarina spongiae]|uniref:EamA domain-containing membrane protein RarD n=1 Tax=Aquimarina spongiae TaxID=570521 RepID=A0A1M6IEQ7_9FLAO|nr:EamA family transporter [Aquimarina spongiae]SHJ32905.1 EamA domain-containing membrane protein RarD [Aquimarina spongiae]
MPTTKVKWIYLAVLSLIWGSSFILIKKALIGLTPMQLGALRTVFAALFLFSIGFRSIKTIQAKEWKWIAISALVGTFIPAFLFAFAETEIDSGITSILNSLTPLITFVLGILFFATRFYKNQLVGVIIGFIGCVGLIWEGAIINPDQNYEYALLVIIATFGYGLNVNIIKRYLQHVSPMAIANGNFVVLFFPALIVLFFADFFKTEMFSNHDIQMSIAYMAVLAVIGTGIAKLMFNKLVQISTPVFASSVTYTMPIIALVWGLWDNEKFSLYQLLASGVIIFGVYLTNRNK